MNVIEKRGIQGAAAALSLALCLGCGGESQEPAPQAGAPADEKPASWTVEATPSPGEEGAKQPAPARPVAKELPEDFPTDVPLYPGAEVSASRSAAGEGYAVTFSSTDDPDVVANYLSEQFDSQGWEADLRRTPEGHAIFANKEKRHASVVVRPEGGVTLYDVIIVVKP